MRTPLQRPPRLESAEALRQRAEESSALLPALMVAAERVAATVAQGVHGRRRVGAGDTFWQFRRYQTGDPAQSIDWRQSAKSQAAFVRETEWEAAQTVWLWRDGSASMSYRSSRESPEKLERASVLTLALTLLLVRGGERIALLGRGMTPVTGRSAGNRIAEALMDRSVAPTSLPVVEPLPRHSRLVLIGDFLSPPDEVERMIRGFAGRGVRGHLLQVVDEAEETLPFQGRIRFEGLEGEGSALIGRVEALRGEYELLFHEHREALRDLARSVGWGFTAHHTSSPPQTALLALFVALSERSAA